MPALRGIRPRCGGGMVSRLADTDECVHCRRNTARRARKLKPVSKRLLSYVPSAVVASVDLIAARYRWAQVVGR